MMKNTGEAERQWVSLRTANVIERMQLEFRRRVKTRAALPNEGAVLRVFFGLWISGQMKLRRIKGYRDIGGTQNLWTDKWQGLANPLNQRVRRVLAD